MASSRVRFGGMVLSFVTLPTIIIATRAALKAVQEEAQSKLPTLGYTVPYAIGNILLTAWGPVIVAMMA